MMQDQTFSVDSSEWLGASQLMISLVSGQECGITSSPLNMHQVYVLGTKRPLPDTMMASERALAKDWNTPQEDSAWASL